jgi:hypothetical protein
LQTPNILINETLNNRIYNVIIFSFLLCLSPFNILGYLAPSFTLFFILLFANSKKMIFNLILVTVSWLYLCILYKYFYLDNYFFGNGVLAFITYSSFLPLIVISSNYFNDSTLFFKISRILLIVILVEALIGGAQAIYGFSQIGEFDINNGDYVEGTIHLPLDTEGSMSNPIFSIIISTILIFLFGHYKISKIGKYHLIIGTVILLMASTMHVIVSLFISYFLTKLLVRNYRISIIKRIFITGLIILTFFTYSKIMPSNFSSIYNHGKSLLENKYPKTAVLYNYFNEISKNNIAIKTFGLGPGQFLSRASFISTGKYFGTNSDGIKKLEIPFTGMTLSFKNGVSTFWDESINDQGYGSSSTAKPQSSWNALITEFGIFGYLLVVFFLLIFFSRIRKRLNNRYYYNIGFSLIWCTVFIFLIGFQENYWEVPQAIFIGFILMKISYSLIINKTYPIINYNS